MIIARENDNPLDAGQPGRTLSNGGLLRIGAVGENDLIVSRLSRPDKAGGDRTWSAPFTVTKSYARAFCDLGYAQTWHTVEGQTVAVGAEPADAAETFTTEDRAAIWDHATSTAVTAAEQVRQLTVTDPDLAAHAAWAAADKLHAAAAALAAKSCARPPTPTPAPPAHLPAHLTPVPAGNGLRRAARLLALARRSGRGRTQAQLMPIARLAPLIEAIADLRAAQRHAAQAAARTAAERLHAARCAYDRRAAPQPSRGHGPAGRGPGRRAVLHSRFSPRRERHHQHTALPRLAGHHQAQRPPDG